MAWSNQDLKVLVFAITTNTQTCSTKHILGQPRRYFSMTSEQSTQANCPILTSSVEDFLAKLSQLPEEDKDLTTAGAISFLTSFGFSKTKDPDIWYSKTLKGYLITTVDKLSSPLLKNLPTLGIECNGRFLILSSSAFLKTGKECILSDVLETNVSEKYFLSPQTQARILAQF